MLVIPIGESSKILGEYTGLSLIMLVITIESVIAEVNPSGSWLINDVTDIGSIVIIDVRPTLSEIELMTAIGVSLIGDVTLIPPFSIKLNSEMFSSKPLENPTLSKRTLF